MNELMTIQNVRGYVGEDGTAWLNLEDVARGLGFTTVATSGNECVRWSRVQEYLSDLNYPCGSSKLNSISDFFIPENIFYRLAMKAKNDTAEIFQAKVADEILPAIRKTGQYSVKPKSQAEIILESAQLLVEHEQKMNQLEDKTRIIESRMDTLDGLNVEGDDRQKLNAMIRKYALANGVLFNVAWGEFKTRYNTAYRTNLESKMKYYKQAHGLKKKPTIPEYLEAVNSLEDGLRVADKMLN
ncbi:MAG: hypothetical protein M0R06_09330 [Sphaerochaeta sp.]|jgi:prophage antirepressor-like protein|nr:hypothetical protein [Sphaerochaeta sp.]